MTPAPDDGSKPAMVRATFRAGNFWRSSISPGAWAATSSMEVIVLYRLRLLNGGYLRRAICSYLVTLSAALGYHSCVRVGKVGDLNKTEIKFAVCLT